VKVALATGASLVPVVSFGENDVVTVVNTRNAGWARSVRLLCWDGKMTCAGCSLHRSSTSHISGVLGRCPG